MNELKRQDFEIYNAIKNEDHRQKNGLEMIASENYVSRAVLEAMGSILTNKYAEGYPGKRYYGGCENVDVVENLAIERLKKLFNCEHANVQPHSGANANLAGFLAVLNPGDTVLGMSLDAGGHLSHGTKMNISGKVFNSVSYGVDKNGFIDYDEVEKLALEHKPKLIVCGASAYPRVIDFKRFKEIADKVGAYLMADIAHIAGLVIAGLHESPIPYADIVTSTTHKTLRGPRGGVIMCKQALAKKIDSAIFPGSQGGPLEHIIAGKAVAFKEAMSPKFIDYQKQIIKNSKILEKVFIKRKIKMVSGGTDNHLILLDLTDKNMTGLELENLLAGADITVNKNCIPFDPQKPTITSGVRIGTPALTSRGMKEPEMEIIGNVIADIVEQKENAIPNAKKIVANLCRKFKIR